MENRLQEFIHFAEIKQLAYQIAALQQEKMFRSLAVLSVFPGEGKTLFCAAMAMAYAETCRSKVLVVDTSTLQNKNSLRLKQCFNGSAPLVEVLSVEDLRKGSRSFGSTSMIGPSENTSVLESRVVHETPTHVTVAHENEFSILKKIAEDSSDQYGLVLLDTTAMQSRNRSNMDPTLAARLSHASVLVVSRRFLDSPELPRYLATLKDPSLHLIGMISSEVHS